jgi:putative flippase GtrA
MTGIHALARRLYADRAWPFQLARYGLIGGLATGVDLGSFVLLLRAGLPLMAVITVSYAFAVATHFSLNKYANFRAHDRPLRYQAANYAIVTAICYATTTAIVKGGVALGFAPLLGKLFAVTFNVPIAFLGHRYLTFGRGITAAVRSVFTRRML